MQTRHPPAHLKPLRTLADIRARHNVRHITDLGNSLVAFRDSGLWHYYRYSVETRAYELTGRTQKLESEAENGRQTDP